ncbi:hypothetical protein ALC62_01388, partial [Cyphomyrmex costatus]
NEHNLEKVITYSALQYDNNFIDAVSNCNESSNSFSCTDINSDVSSSQNSLFDKQNSLGNELAKWAIERHISHLALTDLLHILSPYHPELPLHSRTLLRTVTTTEIYQLETGELCYLGLTSALKNLLSQRSSQEYVKPDEALKICFNIDGIPLFKSNKLQLWPILELIKNFPSVPFVVSVFCGTSKPKPLNIFLENFINKLNVLLRNGFNLDGNIFKIEVHSFVCDAPARAFLKCTKLHLGHSSCDKCTEPGKYYKNKVVFMNETAQKRTDKSFRKQLDDTFKFAIDLIQSFPTDYKHNICLGVMKLLLRLWIAGSLRFKLTNNQVQIVSQRLINLQQFIPLEFSRKPRSLNKFSYWKATEFRTFLIYVGVLVLKNILPKAFYKNFLLLHVAISILILNKHINNFGIPFAQKCLLIFINHCKNELYGPEFAVYNIHLLTHICDDVEIYGPLDEFSSFPFKSYLGHLKKLIRSPTNLLQQIHRRLHEIDSFLLNKHNLKNFNRNPYFLDMEHKNGPLLNHNTCESYKQYKKITFTNVQFSINQYNKTNSYCMLKDDTKVVEGEVSIFEILPVGFLSTIM